MSKVTDSDTESHSSDIESLLSYNDPSMLVPYCFEPFASSNDEALKEMFSSNYPAIVEEGILNGVIAIMVNR